MQREHLVVLAGEDFVARLNDQFVPLLVETLAGMVGYGSGLLQDGVGGDHLTRNQVLADAEMLERALGLSAPELVLRHIHDAEAVCFFSHVGHISVMSATNASPRSSVPRPRLLSCTGATASLA